MVSGLIIQSPQCVHRVTLCVGVTQTKHTFQICLVGTHLIFFLPLFCSRTKVYGASCFIKQPRRPDCFYTGRSPDVTHLVHRYFCSPIGSALRSVDLQGNHVVIQGAHHRGGRLQMLCVTNICLQLRDLFPQPYSIQIVSSRC